LQGTGRIVPQIKRRKKSNSWNWVLLQIYIKYLLYYYYIKSL